MVSFPNRCRFPLLCSQRNQPDIAGHLVTGGEAARVSEKHIGRQGRHRTHARVRQQPARLWPLSGLVFHFFVQFLDSFLQLYVQAQQFRSSLTGVGWQRQCLQCALPRCAPELMLVRAIAARVPGAKFGMPDIARNASWLTEIADQWPSIQSPPQVTTLTHHYYFGGPATNPEVNIPNLLKPATMQKVQNTANIATAAAGKIGARVRMTEGNTCYRGGKPGVSDVFAAALWSADYSLRLANNNYLRHQSTRWYGQICGEFCSRRANLGYTQSGGGRNLPFHSPPRS